jgi:hypothetical protein
MEKGIDLLKPVTWRSSPPPGRSTPIAAISFETNPALGLNLGKRPEDVNALPASKLFTKGWRKRPFASRIMV